MIDVNKEIIKLLNSLLIINIRAVGIEINKRMSMPELKQIAKKQEKRRDSAPCDLCYGQSCLLGHEVKNNRRKIRQQHVAYLAQISRTLVDGKQRENFNFDHIKLSPKKAKTANSTVQRRHSAHNKLNDKIHNISQFQRTTSLRIK